MVKYSLQEQHTKAVVNLVNPQMVINGSSGRESRERKSEVEPRSDIPIQKIIGSFGEDMVD